MLKWLLLLLALGFQPGAHAEGVDKPIVLRLADGFPTGHVLDRLIVAPFIKAVETAGQGRVVIQHFPAEQLGKSKDMLILTQAGVTDIGYIVPSYMSDRLPLSAVTELPGLFQSTCQANAALRNLTADGAILDRLEFAPNGIKPLMVFLMPAYQLLLSTAKPLDSVKAIEGLKIRTPGGAMDLTIRGLGGVPIRMQPADLFESMSRGTVEGALLPYLSAVSYSLAGMLKLGTMHQDFGTVAITFSIARDRWDALPDDVRTILADAGHAIELGSCTRFDLAEAEAGEKLATHGTHFVALGPEDHAALEAEFQKVRTDWAQRLDARGKQGSAVLSAFVDAVATAAPH